MDCVVCNGQMNLIQYKVYKCIECRHTYIAYDGDGLMYHKVLYRTPGQAGSRANHEQTGEIENGKFTPGFHKRRENICKKRIEFINPFINEVDSLLDIGAGGGTFLNMVKDKFTLAEGTEISDVCNASLTNDGYKVYHGAFTQMKIDKVYDLVTCWHVLEHIQDLTTFPQKLFDVTGKYAILEVPINRRLRNPDDAFDGHFHYFSEQSLRCLFEDLFEVDYIKPGVQMPCLIIKLNKK